MIDYLDNLVGWQFPVLIPDVPVVTNNQVYFGMLDALLDSEMLPAEYQSRCQVNTGLMYLFAT